MLATKPSARPHQGDELARDSAFSSWLKPVACKKDEIVIPFLRIVAQQTIAIEEPEPYACIEHFHEEKIFSPDDGA
ncbi:MAG TPA: hypothetical protein P5102_16615 [Candidatus Competibacteraceae bacterium]|nr:hypothetical protein [Candidatus Competibacteraceae bacterium]